MHRSGRRPPGAGRRWTWALGTVLGICAVVGANNYNNYPEIGKEIKGEARKKYTEWLDCAMKQLPGTPGEKVKHCQGKGKDVAVHEAGKGIKYAFSPHIKPEDLKKCKVCLAVNPKELCPWIDCYNNPPGNNEAEKKKNKKKCEEFLKGLFRHEIVHWTQWCVWDLWEVTNDELFNFPLEAGQDPEGRNGNPEKQTESGNDGEQQNQQDDEKKKADKLARDLKDKFDAARSALTELEAVVIGNVRGGCIDKETGKPYFEPKKAGEKAWIDQQCCDFKEKKEKLFKAAEAAKKKQGDAYKKVREFAKKLCDKKKKYCKKADEVIEAKEKARKKWESQKWKPEDDK